MNLSTAEQFDSYETIDTFSSCDQTKISWTERSNRINPSKCTLNSNYFVGFLFKFWNLLTTHRRRPIFMCWQHSVFFIFLLKLCLTTTIRTFRRMSCSTLSSLGCHFCVNGKLKWNDLFSVLKIENVWVKRKEKTNFENVFIHFCPYFCDYISLIPSHNNSF